MGWNGSGQKGATSAQPKVTAKKPSPVRGLVAGGLVIILAVIAYFVFFSGSEKPQTEKAEKERGRIKAVTPAAASTNAVPEKAKKNVEIRKLENGKLMKYVDGKPVWMFPREDYHGPVITTRVSRVDDCIEDRTFQHTADRQIASLLLIKPGSRLTGHPRYERTFVRDFLESYKNPFIIEPGDTEEQKDLKRAVAEVKGDLKARHEAGEDIAKVMSDSFDQLQQLGLYKEELRQQVIEMSKKEGSTAEDLEDFISAANVMLKDRGCEPMKVNGFLKHQLNVLKRSVSTDNQTQIKQE